MQPQLDLKTVQLVLPAGPIGPSAGEFFAAKLPELVALRLQSGGDRQQFIKALMLSLQKDGLITFQDVEQLEKVSDIVFAKVRGEFGVNEYAIKIRTMNRDMVREKNPSQIALSIMSILAEASVAAVLRESAGIKEWQPLEQEQGPLTQESRPLPNFDTGSLPMKSADGHIPSMELDEGIILEGGYFVG